MDRVMELAKELQNKRYSHQDVDIQEDINVGTFKNADVSGIKALAVVVYDITTADKPGWYVARIFAEGRPTNCHICRRSYEEITKDITQAFPKLIPFPRGAEDDKVIIEVWM